MKTEIDNYLKNISMPKPQIKLTSLRFCLQCKQVWEQWSYVKHFYMKHSDMPSYGLERETCCDCKLEGKKDDKETL